MNKGKSLWYCKFFGKENKIFPSAIPSKCSRGIMRGKGVNLRLSGKFVIQIWGYFQDDKLMEKFNRVEMAKM